eukprot:TRINITY_DN1539_c0_g1_i1.p1 TRINITY_DN1539_c0_g1~~TRINITY_DN1539_c0_g1_i1.p1  ORF type:complete len:337 (-),score=115.81 TRINITY_DN1539_c0_g1_i1:63-1037(-)
MKLLLLSVFFIFVSRVFIPFVFFVKMPPKRTGGPLRESERLELEAKEMESNLSDLRRMLAAERQKRDTLTGTRGTGRSWGEQKRKGFGSKSGAGATKGRRLSGGKVSDTGKLKVMKVGEDMDDDAIAASIASRTKETQKRKARVRREKVKVVRVGDEVLSGEKKEELGSTASNPLDDEEEYDESASHAYFMEALEAWRHSGGDVDDGGGKGGAEGGGKLLEGPAFDEKRSHAMFVEAVEGWRRATIANAREDGVSVCDEGIGTDAVRVMRTEKQGTKEADLDDIKKFGDACGLEQLGASILSESYGESLLRQLHPEYHAFHLSK